MRIIELDDLHIFRTVVREGGVVKAAAVLNRVPSNISTRIKQFEARLGTALFRRQGRNIVLSEAGSVLLRHAERLLQLADEAEQELCHGVIRGNLRLGALESAASVRLPSLLAQYHASHPDTHVELLTATTAALLQMLEVHRIEAAFVSEPCDKDTLSTQLVCREELVLITALGHPGMDDRQALASQTVVAFPHGCSYRRLLVDWFAEAGITPARFLDLASYHAIVACVAAGAGIAMVPASVLDQAVAGRAVQRHPVPEKFRFSQTHLVWHGEASVALQALCRQIQLA